MSPLFSRVAMLLVPLGMACAAGACAAGAAPAASAEGDSGSDAPVSTGAPEAGPAGEASTLPPYDAGAPDDSGRDSASKGDAGSLRADVPSIPCTDALTDVYVWPTGLPPMTMAARGDVVRCAVDTQLSMSDEISAFSSVSVTGVTPSTGTNLFRIEYRTYRDDGVPGFSSARVYLPQTPRSLPLPVVAIAHPTEGLAASCTPSQVPTSLEDEALPWAAQGFAVIATDYAGLGTPGVQGYFDNHDQAHSVLDSARALRAILPAGVLDDDVLLVGYSQGGGAVLASQGLASSYGAGGTVKGIVVFAAEYFERMNSVQYVNALESPDSLTITMGVTVPVVAATRDYAYAYNTLGADAGVATLFPSNDGPGIASQLMSLCEVPFGGYLQGVAPHVGDIFDPDFRASLLACIAPGESDAGCSGAASQFYKFLQADLVAPDPKGAPVLYIAGLSDTIMPPAQEAACNIDQLQAAGVAVQVCTDPQAQHTDVVARNVSFALEWTERLLYGSMALPSCSAAGMPACTP